MVLDSVQKSAKMSFSIADLAKSSRDVNKNQSEAIVYNINHYQTKNYNKETSSPMRLPVVVTPLTSTPLSHSVIKPNNERQPKRKRKVDSIYSEDSSLDSFDSKSSDSVISTSDDDQPGKRTRYIFTRFQVTELEKYYYNTNKFLSVEERTVLSKRLDLQEKQIKTWFQNRRMKDKRHQKKSGQHIHHLYTAAEIPTAMGMPYSSACHPAHLLKYSSHQQQQYPAASPVPQIFDPMSYMCSYGPVSPIMYSGYQQHFYNGLSPKSFEQYRV
jgi:hypothetical protein